MKFFFFTANKLFLVCLETDFPPNRLKLFTVSHCVMRSFPLWILFPFSLPLFSTFFWPSPSTKLLKAVCPSHLQQTADCSSVLCFQMTRHTPVTLSVCPLLSHRRKLPLSFFKSCCRNELCKIALFV